MGIGERQEDAEGLIRRRILDKVDRAQDVGPITVVIDLLAAGVELPHVEGVIAVALRRLTPRFLAIDHPGRLGRSRGLVLDVTVLLVAELSGDQVVLATPPDEIAVVTQHAEQVGLPLVITQHVVHRSVPTDVRIPPGHETAAAGRTDRVLARRHAKRDGIGFDQPVKIGRDRGRITKVTHHVAPPLVGVEDQDVRPTCHQDNSSIELKRLANASR